MNPTLADLYELIQTGNKELKQEIATLKESLDTQISSLKIENELLKKENSLLNQRILEVERRTKKYSFIVYGLKSSDDQTSCELLNIIKDILLIDCQPNDFRDIFRVGAVSEGHIRPVVVEVLNYNLKSTILSRARIVATELKKLKVSFTHDLTKEDYQKRKFMGHQLKQAKLSNPSAVIKKDNLIVGDLSFSYEELKERSKLKDITSISSNSSSSSFAVATRENRDSEKKRKFGFSPSNEDTDAKQKLRSHSTKQLS